MGFMDSRIDERSQVYIIERTFDRDYAGQSEAHVDSHAHNCDSVFAFMGNAPDGTGLTVRVTFGKGCKQLRKLFPALHQFIFLLIFIIAMSIYQELVDFKFCTISKL